MTTIEPTHDVIVLGGGPVGENVAQAAIAGSDRTAALVEAELVGGECSYWACMPSKALLTPSAVRDRAMHLPGVEVGALDVASVLERRDAFTSHWSDAGQVEWAEGAGLEVVRGHGTLVGERTVRVGERTLVARHAVVLATGSVPVTPPVPGLAEALPWSSRDATALHEVPDSVLVVGGGVVGCEAATWLAALGARVTLVARHGLLDRLEPAAGERVAEGLRAAGVDVRTGASVERVEREGASDTGVGHVHGGPVRVVVDGAGIEVAEVLVATGRRPATEGLGLDAVGIERVEVDEHLRVRGVDGDWLWACGDVAGRTQLTHMGKHEARLAGEAIARIADGGSADDAPALRDGTTTQVVFTQPEVASVGRTEREARDAGLPVEALTIDLAVAGSSLARDDWSGAVTVVVDTESEVLLGATLVGPDVAELLHAATIAVVAEVPMATLWHAVPAYPTISEVWLRVSEAWRAR